MERKPHPTKPEGRAVVSVNDYGELDAVLANLPLTGHRGWLLRIRDAFTDLRSHNYPWDIELSLKEVVGAARRAERRAQNPRLSRITRNRERQLSQQLGSPEHG